jgi:hypothetical protein
LQNIEIVIINKGEPPRFDEELAQDVIEIMTVLSARLYGSRSHKTKRLLEDSRNEDGSPRKTHDSAASDPIARLLNSMHEAQARAALLYADLLEQRHAASS